MKTTSLSALLRRMTGEYLAKDSIYGIPGSAFRPLFDAESESPGLDVMSRRIGFPVGPAAGPHTQIAPNILTSYLCGARVFELKTVQKNDSLDIDKPCIDALDEGHNVEWSTELGLEAARREYLNGWLGVNLLASIFSRTPNDFFFNASVGYTLEGIMGEKMDTFIEGLSRPEATSYWDQAASEFARVVGSDAFASAFGDAARSRARTLAAHLPVRPLHSVTLSTMHGCPPAEIGRIGRYLIEEKGFDTYIKLNPTLVGFDRARFILDSLGWTSIVLKKESFDHDLGFAEAISLVKELSAAAQAKGRRFGIKLSNTLANANPGDRLPGTERYMSGRALFPITIRLAADLAVALPDFGSRFSFCGGVSAFNAAELIKAGVGPLTIVTDILKPGGYLRMAQVAREAAQALSGSANTPDAAALGALAEASLARPEYRFGWKAGTVAVPGPLPLFDCFAAPCIQACPVNQKVPAYLDAQGSGRNSEALSIILSDNPLPGITGTLCDHVCQERCSRLDYEGPVRIRDVKLEAAKGARLTAAPLAEKLSGSLPAAIVGAGPAGLACAHFLALSGLAVTVFDAGPCPGGVPAKVIPGFRIERKTIAADIDRIASLGVEFVFNAPVTSLDELRARGFGPVFLAVGAEAARPLRLKGSGLKAVSALEFLSAFGSGRDVEFQGLRHIVVAGGGNTACDAVRAASRIPGLESVVLAYRRTRAEMPADREELEIALAEASALAASGPRDATPGSSPQQTRILLELSLPESASPGSLTLRRMKLGPKDASGRRSPKPTKENFSLPCDLLVSAVGEEPDRKLLAGFGVEFGEDGLPVVDSLTLESGCPGVYVGGDARKGPGSIIGAEADGRMAARAMAMAAGRTMPESDYTSPALDHNRLSRRGQILVSLSPGEPGFAAREAERCLACDSACLRCVEVCPNRANLFLEIGRPFSQDAQILHVDSLCNECGNCGFFCPWEGEPFTGKPTLFDTVEDLEASKNAGFTFGRESGEVSLVLRNKVSGAVTRLDQASWNGVSSLPGQSAMAAMAREVFRRHAYLLEEKR